LQLWWVVELASAGRLLAPESNGSAHVDYACRHGAAAQR
jgi:hypothetical protein